MATRSALLLILASLVALSMLALVGCSAGASKTTHSSAVSPASTAGSVTASSSAAIPVSPSATDANSIAARQATAFVPTYLAGLDKLYSDPTDSINDIYLVAVQPEATNEALGIAKYRASNYRQSGSQHLITVSGPSVHMSGLGGNSGNASYPTVQLTACVDVSAVTVTDAQGERVGNPDKPTYLIESLTIVNINYPAAAGWRVSDAPNRPASACDA